MVVFISGSVNAGKSTTSKLLAEKLGAEWIDIDELAHAIPDFDLSKDIPKAIKIAIEKINQLTASGKNVVANYVLRQVDYKMLHEGIHDKQQYYFTLAPRLDIVRKDRGRGMNEWEYDRIKHHYDIGIANPKFGEILDTSELTIEEAVQRIINELPL
jgi:uridine kinase